MGCGASKGSHDDDDDNQSSMFRCGTKKEQLANGDFPVNGSNGDGRRSMSSSLSPYGDGDGDGEGEAAMTAPETDTESRTKDGGGGEEMVERGREEEGEGDGKASSHEEVGLVIPGSPSFREYCSITVDDDDDGN